MLRRVGKCMKKYSAILLSAVLLILSLSVSAFAAKNTPYPPPTQSFFVNDFADCISDADEQKMQSMAEELYKKTGAQVVCVTVNNLDGKDVRDYALGLGREWGIGSKNDNNGVLLLLAVDDRQVDIEVGYGLEGTLTDGKTGRILANYAIPYLKSDDFSTGLREAFSALIGETATEYGVEINGSSLAPDEDEDEEYESSKAVIIDFIIFIIILLVIRKITGRTPFIFFGGGGNHHSGGGFSGGGFSGGSSGGFSGGGGSFGGGGSSRGF